MSAEQKGIILIAVATIVATFIYMHLGDLV